MTSSRNTSGGIHAVPMTQRHQPRRTYNLSLGKEKRMAEGAAQLQAWLPTLSVLPKPQPKE